MPDDLKPASRNFDTQIPCIRNQVSPEEWAARVDLAACYRLIDLYGMSDLIANHVSARVPGEPGHFLINPYGLLYDEMTASGMLKIDLDGNVIARPPFDYGVNHAGFVIHSAIHRARHDVDCVIHTHTAAGMAVSALDCGLLPINQTAMRFAHVAYHDYEGVALDLDERPRLQRDLNTKNIMLLRNHGTLTVGRSVAEAFLRIYFLERACTMQVRTFTLGGSPHQTASAVIEKNAVLAQGDGMSTVAENLAWPALLRKLDRVDPSFRN